MGGYMVQINKVKEHSPKGEEQVAYLFSAVMLLQFPGLSGMGEKGGLLFYKGLF